MAAAAQSQKTAQQPKSHALTTVKNTRADGASEFENKEPATKGGVSGLKVLAVRTDQKACRGFALRNRTGVKAFEERSWTPGRNYTCDLFGRDAWVQDLEIGV